MKQVLKLKIANLATWVMIAAVGLIILWLIGFIVSNTFNLNVFTGRTKEFFFSLIGFAFILVACAAFITISLSISLIADSKIHDLKIEKTKTIFSKKLLYVVGLLIAALIAFLFIGDYLTSEHEKNKLTTEAKDLVDRYDSSIGELALSVRDTSKIGKVPEILKFLSNQKFEVSDVTLITSTKYNNEMVYLELNNWMSAEKLRKPYFDYSFYKCRKVNCDYLSKVFENKTNDSYLATDKNCYLFYYPVDKNGQRIILLFTKYKRSGWQNGF